jgi:3-oxoacyl-[acyl-carrier-protein] synthase III
MQDNATITEKLAAITGIMERRYASKELVASDLGFFATQKVIKNSQIDPEIIH